MSADLSTLFDVGGIIGAIAAGVLSDYSGMSALTCAVMFGLAFPVVSTIFFSICYVQTCLSQNDKIINKL